MQNHSRNNCKKKRKSAGYILLFRNDQDDNCITSNGVVAYPGLILIVSRYNILSVRNKGPQSSYL